MNRIKILFPLALLVMLFAGVSPKAAATIYVSPTGNDLTGDGTVGNPYKTLGKALTMESSGDTVRLTAGTHTDVGNVIPTSLAIAAGPGPGYTKIEGAGIDSTILQVSYATDIFWQLYNTSYVEISGITFNSSALYYTTMDFWYSDNFYVHDCKFTGSVSNFSGGITMRHGVSGVAENHLIQRNIFTDIAGSYVYEHPHHVYLKGTGHTVELNNFSITSFTSAGTYPIHGYDITGPDYLKDCVIRWNTIERGGNSYEGGIYLGAGSGNKVYSNALFNVGFGIRNQQNDSNVFMNNSIYGNGVGTGIWFYTDVTNAVARNNAVYNFVTQYDPSGCSAGCSNLATYNLENLNSGTNPNWVNPAAGDLHPQAGSPLIDAGSDESATISAVDLDAYTRVAPWDYGAYEYIASGTVLQTRDFNGATSTIDWGDINALDGLAAMSIAFDIKWNTRVESSQILEKRPASGINGFGVQSFTATGDEIGFVIGTGAAIKYGYTTAANLSASVWYKIRIVYLGAGAADADKLKIYVDGVDKALTFLAGLPASATANAETLQIGGPLAPDPGADALIVNIRIWNTNLSAGQVTTSLTGPVLSSNMRLCTGIYGDVDPESDLSVTAASGTCTDVPVVADATIPRYTLFEPDGTISGATFLFFTANERGNNKWNRILHGEILRRRVLPATYSKR